MNVTNQEQYEHQFEVRGRDVYFAGERVPLSILKPFKTSAKTAMGCDKYSESSWTNLRGEGFQNFYNKWKISPTNFRNVFLSLWLKHNVEPVKEWVWQFAYTGGGKFSVDINAVFNIWDLKDEIIQAKEDGLESLIPFIVHWGITIPEAKNRVGKGVWKRLCKNSKTRNHLIAKNHRNGGADEVKSLMGVPSTVLKKGCLRFDAKTLSILSKHFKAKDIVQSKVECVRFANVIVDTVRMSSDLDVKYNPEWSMRKWIEKHEEFSREVLSRQYPDEVYDCFKDVPERLRYVHCEGITAELVQTPLRLHQEGSYMKHCAGSFNEMIGMGTYVVYHLSGDGVSSTTLSFTKLREAGWHPHQHYGACNSASDVTQSHLKLEREIKKLLNEVWV